MAFLPINFEDGQLIKLPMSDGGSTANYTVGQALKVTSGLYITATAGQGTDVEAICMEAGTISNDGELLSCISTRGVRFIADGDADPIASEAGTYVDLASATELDTSASSDDLFYLEKVRYPLSARKVEGFFQHGTPLTT